MELRAIVPVTPVFDAQVTVQLEVAVIGHFPVPPVSTNDRFVNLPKVDPRCFDCRAVDCFLRCGVQRTWQSRRGCRHFDDAGVETSAGLLAVAGADALDVSITDALAIVRELLEVGPRRPSWTYTRPPREQQQERPTEDANESRVCSCRSPSRHIKIKSSAGDLGADRLAGRCPSAFQRRVAE